MKILEVKNLSVKDKKGKLILKDISFDVEKNSIHIILGPNGSGKSTLAFVLMGLREFRMVSGKIFFDKGNITYLSPSSRAKRGISLAFQEPVYIEGIKVKDFLLAGNRKASLGDLRKSLLLVGLSPEKFLERNLDRSLSGGERKRIELSSLILMRPKLMILDEPDSGLDIVFYKQFSNFLRKIKKETGSTILLITHREEKGLENEKATLLYKGSVLDRGTFKDLIKRYGQYFI